MARQDLMRFMQWPVPALSLYVQGAVLVVWDLELVRKLILSAVIIFIVDLGPDIRLAVAYLISFLSLLVVFYAQPFVSSSLDRLMTFPSSHRRSRYYVRLLHGSYLNFQSLVDGSWYLLSDNRCTYVCVWVWCERVLYLQMVSFL